MCGLPTAKSPKPLPVAIYHLSASIIKRSAGKSVTAAAAYRAGEKIEDVTTGLTHDYTRKGGVDHSEILTPISPSAGNEWMFDRQELWNRVEQGEKRHDAQLAREVTLAIPSELSRVEQIALVREYVQTNYVQAGMIADVNLHHLDGDNPHAHILLSMRSLETSPEGLVEFGLKNTDWNRKDFLLTQRKSWEIITNKYLKEYGDDIKIDCRSLKDQGSPYIPQIHLGVHAAAMLRKGIATDRSEEFDRIESANNDIREQLEEAYQNDSACDVAIEELDFENERIREENLRLGDLVLELTKDTQSFVKFQDYKIRRCDENLEVWIAGNDGISGKILEINREDAGWNVDICIPQGDKTKDKYSEDFINELVNNFKQSITQPSHLEENQKLFQEIKLKYFPPKIREDRPVYQPAPTEAQEVKRLESELNPYQRQYWNARDKADKKIKEYAGILNLKPGENFYHDSYYQMFREATSTIYENTPSISRNNLPRAGDTIDNYRKESTIYNPNDHYDDMDIPSEGRYRKASTDDKYLEFEKRKNIYLSKVKFMEDLELEIELRIKEIQIHKLNALTDLIPTELDSNALVDNLDVTPVIILEQAVNKILERDELEQLKQSFEVVKLASAAKLTEIIEPQKIEPIKRKTLDQIVEEGRKRDEEEGRNKPKNTEPVKRKTLDQIVEEGRKREEQERNNPKPKIRQRSRDYER
jgi:MobA/MobL family